LGGEGEREKGRKGEKKGRKEREKEKGLSVKIRANP
jgi:hypothetical protein